MAGSCGNTTKTNENVDKIKVIEEKITMELISNQRPKEASINYCVDLLTNRTPKAGYEEDILLKNSIHEVRLEKVIENNVVFNKSKNHFRSSKRKIRKNMNSLLMGETL